MNSCVGRVRAFKLKRTGACVYIVSMRALRRSCSTGFGAGGSRYRPQRGFIPRASGPMLRMRFMKGGQGLMSFRVKSKIWIENDEGKLIIGTGRVRILEAIMEHGSINKAAQNLKQPFRVVWGKIKATEERCGFKLVETTNAGSRLTREGVQLLSTYKRFHDRCEQYVNEEFREGFGDQARRTKKG